MLKARLADIEQRIAASRVPVARGGRRLLRARANLAVAGMTEAQWRARWDAGRLFLTADGERDEAWGNETIEFHPDQGWVEIKLPGPTRRVVRAPRHRVTGDPG